MSALYTASAMATGEGRDGHVRSSDGLVDFDLTTPKEMGGPGGASNPEQLFAAGYSACFHSALKLVARRQRRTLADSSVTAEVTLERNGSGGYGLSVKLLVELTGIEQDAADALVEAAHHVCPYSNATRGNIPVTLEAIVA